MSEPVEFEAKVSATPKDLARAFWNFDNKQQAEFFEHLHDITHSESNYASTELQWCYMSEEIEKRPKAKEQACSMMVWIFNRATDFLSRNPSY